MLFLFELNQILWERFMMGISEASQYFDIFRDNNFIFVYHSHKQLSEQLGTREIFKLSQVIFKQQITLRFYHFTMVSSELPEDLKVARQRESRNHSLLFSFRSVFLVFLSCC